MGVTASQSLAETQGSSVLLFHPPLGPESSFVEPVCVYTSEDRLWEVFTIRLRDWTDIHSSATACMSVTNHTALRWVLGNVVQPYGRTKGSNFDKQLANLCHIFWDVPCLEIQKGYLFPCLLCVPLCEDISSISFAHHYIPITQP